MKKDNLEIYIVARCEPKRSSDFPYNIYFDLIEWEVEVNGKEVFLKDTLCKELVECVLEEWDREDTESTLRDLCKALKIDFDSIGTFQINNKFITLGPHNQITWVEVK